MVNNGKANWRYHENPLTGKKMWYEDWYGEDRDWDWLGGHDDPSTDTKSLQTDEHIIIAVGTPALIRG